MTVWDEGRGSTGIRAAIRRRISAFFRADAPGDGIDCVEKHAEFVDLFTKDGTRYGRTCPRCGHLWRTRAVSLSADSQQHPVEDMSTHAGAVREALHRLDGAVAAITPTMMVARPAAAPEAAPSDKVSNPHPSGAVEQAMSDLGRFVRAAARSGRAGDGA